MVVDALQPPGQVYHTRQFSLWSKNGCSRAHRLLCKGTEVLIAAELNGFADHQSRPNRIGSSTLLAPVRPLHKAAAADGSRHLFISHKPQDNTFGVSNGYDKSGAGNETVNRPHNGLADT